MTQMTMTMKEDQSNTSRSNVPKNKQLILSHILVLSLSFQNLRIVVYFFLQVLGQYEPPLTAFQNVDKTIILTPNVLVEFLDVYDTRSK